MNNLRMLCRNIVFGALAGGFAVTAVLAGPCDYRPSKMARDAAGPASRVASDTAKAVGSEAGAVGFYTLTGGATGSTLLGAGGGASGAMATAGAIATAPVTIIAGAAAAAGLAGYEGFCYFSDKRVTRYDDVLDVMRNLSQNADPAYFRLDPGAGGAQDAVVTIRNSAGEMEQHAVRDLYIVNGVLMYRAKGQDGVIGNIDFVARAAFPTGDGAPLNAVPPAEEPPAGTGSPPADDAASRPDATPSP